MFHHARVRPDRRARRRSPTGATCGATGRSSLLRGLGLDADFDVAADPFFGRGGRMLAASQREQALKFEILVQIARPGADRGRVVQLPPGPLRRGVYGIEHRRRRRGPHRRASASGSSGSRSRCSAPTASTRRRGRTRCARSCGRDEHRDHRDGQPARPRPRDLRAARDPHAGDRTYTETNCYTDILIELLHARGDEPLAALGFTRPDGLRGRPVDVLQAAARGPRAAVRHRHPRDAALPPAARADRRADRRRAGR